MSPPVVLLVARLRLKITVYSPVGSPAVPLVGVSVVPPVGIPVVKLRLKNIVYPLVVLPVKSLVGSLVALVFCIPLHGNLHIFRP